MFGANTVLLTYPQIEDDGSGGDETTQLMYNDQDDDEMDTNQQPGQAADLQMAKKLVRYAIACEFSRTTIRRDGIKERGQYSQTPSISLKSIKLRK